jgi:DnaA family protein
MTQQLVLGLTLYDDAAFANYSSGPNKQIVDTLMKASVKQGEQFIYLWGSGLGRTHLLQACCQQARASHLSSLYLPLARLPELSLEILNDLETLDVICVDDIQNIAGIPHWEEAFFHLYNRLKASQTCLIVSASASPKELGFKTPDLLSRLMWGLIFHLQPLSDQEKLENLHVRAAVRGFQMSDEVAKFLLTRCNRDMRSLIMALDMLDKASVIEKRRLTIPFVKSVLGV